MGLPLSSPYTYMRSKAQLTLLTVNRAPGLPIWLAIVGFTQLTNHVYILTLPFHSQTCIDATDESTYIKPETTRRCNPITFSHNLFES